jgi:hypothetical protein
MQKTLSSAFYRQTTTSKVVTKPTLHGRKTCTFAGRGRVRLLAAVSPLAVTADSVAAAATAADGWLAALH